jgi:hypothetical protein
MSPGSSARLGVVFLLGGFVLLSVLDGGVAHVFGVLALLAAAGLAFGAMTPGDLPEGDHQPAAMRSHMS